MTTIKLLRPIIGIAGRQTSGKSLAAQTLRVSGYRIMAFAKPIKDSLRAMGLNDDEINGAGKELPNAKLGGRSPRWAMRSIGDWGRQLHDNHWVDIARRELADMDRQQPIVFEDVRYQNEVDVIHTFGGIVVKIGREGADTSPADHSSEAMNLTWDMEIDNNGTAGSFIARVKALGVNVMDAADQGELEI